MLIQVKNRVLKLEAVSHAQLEMPSEDDTEGCIELFMIIEGKDIILCADEALTVWHALSRNSLSLMPCSLSGKPVEDAIELNPSF